MTANIPRFAPWLIVSLALILTACATTRAEFDREVDFAQYQTFAWTTPEREAVRDPVLDSQLLDRRVARAVRDKLSERGFREVPPEEADFLITYHTTSREQVYNNPNMRVSLTYGRNYRYYPYWYDPFYGPYTHYSVEQRSYREGTLIIDIIDREREELIWRNWRSSEAHQDRFSEDEVRERVARILREFPPKRS